MVRSLPKDTVGRHFAGQLLRSATSIGANLCEADMSDTARDFCNKVNIAQKEAAETVYWISLLREPNLSAPEGLSAIEAEALALQKICRQIVHSSRRNART